MYIMVASPKIPFIWTGNLDTTRIVWIKHSRSINHWGNGH